MGDSIVALLLYQEAVMADSSHSMAHLNIGNHYFRANKFKQAADTYIISLQSIPSTDSVNR